MSETEQLIQLINGVLQPESEALRKQSEATLVTLRNDKPNELMSAFLTILESEAKIEYRNFSASQLRLNLSHFAPPSFTNQWPKLLSEVQGLIKVKLFEILYKEQDAGMKKHIASTLGEVAGSIIFLKADDWPEFKGHIWTLFKDANLQSKVAAFNTLELFFSYVPKHFQKQINELYALYKGGMTSEYKPIMIATLRCFSTYLSVLPTEQQTVFQDLVIPIYEAVYYLMVSSNEEEGLEVLSEMLDVEPKFFKKKFNELYTLLENIFKLPKIQPSVKRMATEIMVDYAEKSPAMFRKKVESLNGIVQMVFSHMIDIRNEITSEWMTPPEGYCEDNEDDQDFETTRFGMGAVDRLIFAIGEAEMLPVLSNTIQKLLISEDWRHRYTALMALSQIGQYLQEASKIESVLGLIIAFLRDANPMLRYAACHAIGQISDDMQPQFQKLYGDRILPDLLNLLNDPVPRVVAHSSACLTNFVEGLTLQQLEPSLDIIMERLLTNAVNSISLVKESSIGVISSVAEVAKEHFSKYVTRTVEVLFGYFENPSYGTKQYKQLKGQAIETMTILATQIGPEMFRFAAPKLIELLIVMQSSTAEQVDPEKSYVMAGWQRFCSVYGKQLGGTLDRILPSLFALVETVIKKELELVSDPSKEEEMHQDEDNINTFKTEEAQAAISMLNVFIDELKELFGPYVEKTMSLLCTIIKEHPNEDVKEQACRCLPSLINAVKDQNGPMAIQMAKHFMTTLVETIQKEFDTDIMIVELETLKEVIQNLGICFLLENQVESFSKKILEILKSSDESKLSSTKYANSDGIDDDEKEMISEEIKHEEEVQVAICELIGVLFKTHKALTTNLASFIITQILPSVFIEKQSENMLKFGIFLIDDMVEFLGYEMLHAQWFSFGSVLLKYIAYPRCVIRQAAAYGLGIFAFSTPNSVTSNQLVTLWLNSLIEAIKIQKGEEKEKVYGHCRDNVVASVGKIVKAHGNLIDPKPYISVWLMCLPLKHDKGQALEQHELLVDIMLKSPALILGNDKLNGMIRIFQIYGEIVGYSKIYNDEVAKKIRSHITLIQADPFYVQKIPKIWATISDVQRNNLIAFMAGK